MVAAALVVFDDEDRVVLERLARSMMEPHRRAV